MELASSHEWRVRTANERDTSEIGRLLSIANLRHLHADWNLPIDWLGTPGFMLCEVGRSDGGMELVACLAVGADPPPAAWVRVAAVKSGSEVEWQLHEMLEATIPWMRASGVSLLGWLPEESWPDRWLAALGFQRVNWIVTYSLEVGTSPINDEGGTATRMVAIRPATKADAPALARIEKKAFEPLWRHSSGGLLRAFREALTFDVAEIAGQIVGFQYSVAGHDGRSAHLVRLTVAPEAQGQGVGSSLMKAALSGYASKGMRLVTLNTQLDNHASHRLYERFGFTQVGRRAAVWAMAVE